MRGNRNSNMGSFSWPGGQGVPQPGGPAANGAASGGTVEPEVVEGQPPAGNGQVLQHPNAGSVDVGKTAIGVAWALDRAAAIPWYVWLGFGLAAGWKAHQIRNRWKL